MVRELLIATFLLLYHCSRNCTTRNPNLSPSAKTLYCLLRVVVYNSMGTLLTSPTSIYVFTVVVIPDWQEGQLVHQEDDTTNMYPLQRQRNHIQYSIALDIVEDHLYHPIGATIDLYFQGT